MVKAFTLMGVPEVELTDDATIKKKLM